MHWAAQYVGRPWTPESHCWSFFRLIQAEHYARSVPIINVDTSNQRAILHEINTNPERRRWKEVDRPKDGDGVLMSRNTRLAHVGVYVDVDGGRILHCDNAGVLLQSEVSLRMFWPKVTWWTPCF